MCRRPILIFRSLFNLDMNCWGRLNWSKFPLRLLKSCAARYFARIESSTVQLYRKVMTVKGLQSRLSRTVNVCASISSTLICIVYITSCVQDICPEYGVAVCMVWVVHAAGSGCVDEMCRSMLCQTAFNSKWKSLLTNEISQIRHDEVKHVAKISKQRK